MTLGEMDLVEIQVMVLTVANQGTTRILAVNKLRTIPIYNTLILKPLL